jgi:aspartyl-tRNA synthetase
MRLPLPLADMRRQQMQRNLRLSHTVVQSIRRTMDGRDFIDVWTPGMTRGTPEARATSSFPVRLQPGKFFALAQSPQLFKQLCMIGGIDRYYQIATVLAGRGSPRRPPVRVPAARPGDGVRRARRTCSTCSRRSSSTRSRPAARAARAAVPADGLRRGDREYGTDKPDLRFGLEIQDATR